MKKYSSLTAEITLFHDLSTESTEAKNVLNIFSIPYTGIFSDPEANWYLPFMFIGKNSHRIKGLEQIKRFAIEEVKKNKPFFYSGVNYSNDYVTSEKDIWMFESLFGEEELIQDLLKSEKILNNFLVESLFKNSQLKFFTNKDKTILTSVNSELLETYFDKLTEVDYKFCLEKFSIQQLEEAKERGHIKIK